MDEDDDYTAMTVPSCKLQALDVVILVLGTLEDFFGSMCTMLMQHANWKVDRKEVEAEMRADIERIVSE